jgi:hypothetical protein
MLVVKICGASPYPLKHAIHHMRVFRMVTGTDQLKTHAKTWFELEYTIEFVS